MYDTLDNNIGGVSQQQGGDTSLTFSSQYGTIAVSSLPIISGPGLAPQKQTNFVESAPTNNQYNNANNVNANNTDTSAPMPEPVANNANNLSVDDASTDGIIALIEKIAKLHESGALTDEEFNTKKSELLGRI